MKNRFTLLDVFASATELESLIGMRVNNVYDIDNKTYLIKLNRTDEKAVLLFESGVRIHRTFHDWPKSQTPSSFSMKLRKHINQKKLSEVRVLGNDRLVELTFGFADRENKLLIELYDRGNVVLTDGDYTILNILRPRTDKDTSTRWAVKEKFTYEENASRIEWNAESFMEAVPETKEDNLLRILAQQTKFGNSVTRELLQRCELNPEAKIKKGCEYLKNIEKKMDQLLRESEEIWDIVRQKPEGHITFKSETNYEGKEVELYQEFNPVPFNHTNLAKKQLDSFCAAVDEFYSRIVVQKQEQQALNVERQALKKLDNVKKDQETRIEALTNAQEQQEVMANRIIYNFELVERCLNLVRCCLANQLTWDAIEEMTKEAAAKGNPDAKAITGYNFDRNEFIMKLSDPYDKDATPLLVPIDISLSASKNAEKYYVDKKSAAQKIVKTVASAGKAIKNAQEKAKSTLEQVRVVTEIKKSRKAMWFEKFRWFVSSEGYMVIAGRDAQQNELVVKRYLRAGDIYVHADVRGASSVVIRNKQGSGEIPPKTVNEAAQMAVCYSNAWEANVTAAAWWVRHDQVSRTAPTGEYLPSGSFMIRGKKNFVPASQLVMGFGVMFKLDEESAERHRKEQNVAEESRENEEKDEKMEEKEEEIQLEVDEEEDNDEKEDEEEFPDISVPVRSGTTNEEVTIIEVGVKNPKIKSQAPPTKKQETEKYLQQKFEEQNAGVAAKTQKRKQRKEKMAKKKYKDYDDEDLKLHMEMLGHGNKKQEEKIEPKEEKKEFHEKPKEEREEKEKKVKEEEDEEKDEGEDNDLLSTLTQKPTAEDTLLFVIPVVAPYSALSSYKYKVKVTPGPGKRGKAAKSAIELFTRSKESSRECQLIKSLASDDGTSRNLPTKVRISAPQLHKK